MQSKRVSGIIISLLLALAILQTHPAAIVDAEEMPESDVLNFLDAVGYYFEITDSVYRNVTLTSTEKVHVLLESVPQTIGYIIASNNSATSTLLTINGLESNAGYYRYEDGYLMGNFSTNSNGEHTYTQDISEPHHVWIQENASTLYIGSDYTFTSNITEPIVVTASNIVIDGNGYSLKGPGYIGMYLSSRSGVTIKNLIIENWSTGIYAMDSDNNEIRDNSFLEIVNTGVYLGGWGSGSHYNLITSNAFHNAYVGIALYSWGGEASSNTYNTISTNYFSSTFVGILLTHWSSHNTVICNTVTTNDQGILIQLNSNYNLVSGNTITNNYVGIYLWTSYSIIKDNLISNNNHGIWAYAYQCTFYHNNIIQNVYQALDYRPDTNYWHHVDLLEGNYWSDYPGIDDGSGTGKHAIAGDGIGDTDVPWPGQDFDYYPFTRKSGWILINATIDIDPDTLNLQSNGQWITACITLPEGYLVDDIDVTTAEMIYNDFVSPSEWGDIQDGVLMVKFDRIALRDYLGEADLTDGDKFYDITLTIAGQLLDGSPFEGSDTITVIKK